MALDPHDYRSALGCLASGVAVICAKKGSEQTGITVSSLTSLSLNPPLILFCLDAKSSSKKFFMKDDCFSINLLSEEQKNISAIFASRDKKDWGAVPHALLHFKKFRAPVLDHAITHMVCTVEKRIKGGDHLIITGRVHSVSHPNETGKPLLYYRRNYHKLGAVKK